jgi:hypothetical protein
VILPLAFSIFLGSGPATFPSEAVASEFAAICLSQPAGFVGVEAAGRSRGWMSQRITDASAPVTDGALVAPDLPWRRLDYGAGMGWAGGPGCEIVLHEPPCDEVRTLVVQVGVRVGRPPDEWNRLACEAVWRRGTGTRTVVVSPDGHGLIRLFAYEAQTEGAQ